MKQNRLTSFLVAMSLFLICGHACNAYAGESMSKTTESATPITLTVGSTVIPATLNDTLTARRFKDKLPLTIILQRYEVDYCASAPELETDAAEQQNGWKNGDIGYFGGWFTILFDGQETSRDTSGVMIIGRVDEGHLEAVRSLGRSITLTVNLA